MGLSDLADINVNAGRLIFQNTALWRYTAVAFGKSYTQTCGAGRHNEMQLGGLFYKTMSIPLSKQQCGTRGSRGRWLSVPWLFLWQ